MELWGKSDWGCEGGESNTIIGNFRGTLQTGKVLCDKIITGVESWNYK